MSKQMIAGAIASLWLALGVQGAWAADPDPLSRTKTTYSEPDAYGRTTATTVTSEISPLKPTDTTYEKLLASTSTRYATVTDSTVWQLHGAAICTETTRTLSDSQGAVSTRTRREGARYLANGQLSRSIRQPTTLAGCQDAAVNEPPARLYTDYAYKAFGGLETQTVKGLNVSSRTMLTNTYDATGSYVSQATNALGHSAQTVVDLGTGRATSQTDRNDLSSQYEYDALGRLLKETAPDGIETVYSYSACAGACPAEAENAVYYVTREERKPGAADSYTPVAPKQETYYDGLGRVVLSRVEHADLGASAATAASDATTAVTWRITERRRYNARGQVSQQAEPFLAGQTVYWTTFSYDSLGRVSTASRSANGGTVTQKTAYSGLTVTVTNELSQVTKARTGVLGKPVELTDANSVVLQHRYDADGNLTRSGRSETANAGLDRSYSYDEVGNKLTDQDPDLGQWSYSYDGLDQLLTQTDVKSRVTTFTYDVLGRTLKRAEPDLISEWVYDTATGKGKGQLHKATTGVAPNYDYVREVAYDNLSRESTVTSQIDGQSYQFATTYDSLGRADQIVYPNSGGYRHVYDARGYLYQVVDATSGALYWQALTLNGRGQIAKEQYGNGLVTERDYQADTGLLKAVKTGTVSNNVLSASIQNDSVLFDAIGNLKTRTNSLNGLSEGFSYDKLNRITDVAYTGGAVNGQKAKFSYDANGNLLFKSGVGWLTYQATTPSGRVLPHAVSSIDPRGLNADTGTVAGPIWVLISNSGISFPIPVTPRNYFAGGKDPLSYSYDELGNMLSGDGRSIAWTSFNMPSRLTRNGQNTDFLYNGEHERVRKTSNGCSTLYFNPRIDLGGRYEQETCGTTTTARWTLYADEAKGEYVTVTESGAVNANKSGMQYFHTDHLGSVAAVTGIGGTLLTRMSYDVWGQRRNVDGSPLAATPLLPTNRGFTEHEMLDDLGLVHMNARLYDPKLGRFISADPTLAYENDWQDYNLYSYVHNNPLSATDPSGYYEVALGSFSGPNFIHTFTINIPDFNAPRYTSPDLGRLSMQLSQTAGNGWGVGRVPQPGAQQPIGPVVTARPLFPSNSSAGSSYTSSSPDPRLPEPGLGHVSIGPDVVASVITDQANSTIDTVQQVQNGNITPAQAVLQIGGTVVENLIYRRMLGGLNAVANRGGATTKPTLPQRKIAEGKGVSIEHYYKSDDHAPAHAHVVGGGKKTRIGPNGKPLEGDPELSQAQREVVEANKSVIRRAINKIGRWLDYNENE